MYAHRHTATTHHTSLTCMHTVHTEYRCTPHTRRIMIADQMIIADAREEQTLPMKQRKIEIAHKSSAQVHQAHNIQNGTTARRELKE